MTATARIERLKERLLAVRPEMDLENARLLTEGFQEAEGLPLIQRKAWAFRKQCAEKTIFIQDDELIVGCSGSKVRGGILCADTCWGVLDAELDTISTRVMIHSICDQKTGNCSKTSSAPIGKGVPAMSSGNGASQRIRVCCVTTV